MQPTRAALRQSAIASGLVTAAELREAETVIRSDAAKAGSPITEVTSDQLAKQLVAMGRINAWQAAQLKVGRSRFTLGPYRITDSIGQGGMGQVFKGEHTVMGRVVAIKVLPRHKSTPLAIASFTHEIRAQAQLDHENLVRAFDAGHDGNVHFLVTEYVPGTDLRKFVRSRGRLTMQEAATIVSQAANGLAHAHSRGLIHRDIKPGNLLVTPDGHTKVSDLGLAGFLESELGDDPRAGKIIGTADYLSPEHIRTPLAVSTASDVYSLGCTLYYAVTGKVPYPGGTTREKARRHCEDVPLNPKRFNPDLSDEFVDVLAAMMEKDPNKRIQTAMEVRDRLSEWAAERVDATVAISATPAHGLSDPALPTPPQLRDTLPGLFDDPGSAASRERDGADMPMWLFGRQAPFVIDRELTMPAWAIIALCVPIVLAASVLLGSLLIRAAQ